MASAGIEHIDLTSDEGDILRGVVFVEIENLLNGNHLAASMIARQPWERDAQGLLEPMANAEECRARFSMLGDLVTLQDLIGWLDGPSGGTRVYLYPEVVRALRFCRAMFDRTENVIEDYRDEWGLLDTLLAVIDE